MLAVKTSVVLRLPPPPFFRAARASEVVFASPITTPSTSSASVWRQHCSLAGATAAATSVVGSAYRRGLARRHLASFGRASVMRAFEEQPCEGEVSSSSSSESAAAGAGVDAIGTSSPPARSRKPPQVHTDAFATPSTVSLNTIAVVRSPYKERFGCPRQPPVTAGVLGGEAREGQLEFLDNPDGDISLALSDLEGFEYIWVISFLHMNEGWSPRVTPPRGPRKKRGVFATRAPHRPNHLSLSACRLVSVDLEKRIVTVRGLDLLDGTPVLDVKPYVPYCDSFPDARAGWIDELPPPKSSPGRAVAEAAVAQPPLVAKDVPKRSGADEPDHLGYWPPPPHLQRSQ